MIKPIRLTVWLLLTGWARVYAQTPYSLADCVEYSLKHHPSTTVYTNNVGIANQQARQALSAYLPQVSGSASYVDNLKLPTTILPAGVFGPEAKPVMLGNQFNTNAYLDATQLIYDQSRLNGIRATEPYRQLTRLQQEQNSENLIYNTAAAYFQVLI